MTTKSLVFVLVFFAIVAGPQVVVRLLDLAPGARTRTPQPAEPAPAGKSGLKPAKWETVFGPGTDPALVKDARKSLPDLLSSAEEARMAFSVTGSTALAARFGSPELAAQALNRYGTFFQFAGATGSDAGGWTAKRSGGSGEWNHVVTAGSELYAWTGSTKEAVEAQRIRTLGPLPAASSAPAAREAAANSTAGRLSQNPRVMVPFLVLNLAAAVLWFFLGSAWATRLTPPAKVPATDGARLRAQLLALGNDGSPLTVRPLENGRIEVSWNYGDARWLDLMRVHRTRQVHRLVLSVDEAAHTVRVREFWSAFDGSAGPGDVRLRWNGATGMQFLQVERQVVGGLQLDARGLPTGELSAGYHFDVRAMKEPCIQAVLRSGWTWQPVMLG